MYQLVLLSVVAFSICSQSCSQARQPYDIDKTSPDGSYRVKIAVTPGERGKSVDKARFQFFHGQEIIHTWDWQQEDELDVSFDTFMPIEWAGNNVLHIGAKVPKDGFYDELIISNNTNEYLRHVSVSCSRSESFDVFDVDPGSRVTLRATPHFGPKGTQNNSVGYSGITRSGKEFGGVVKGPERESSSDGPLRFQITINQNDLR